MFARLSDGSVLVLDNFQELPEDCALHEALATAMAEVPATATLVVISRLLPSARYARLVANRALTVISWEHLRLTLEETRAIVTSSRAAAALAERLHEQSDGWAAGLTLMLERVRDSNLSESSFAAETREATFTYFAGEVFDHAAPEHQQILLACAFMPRITAAQAERLTGHPGAGRLLDELYRRHLFTDRRLGGEPVFQFHALFRDFLLGKAKEWYTPAGRAQVVKRGARLLEQDGDVENAIALYLRAEEWPDATRLILQSAASLLREGRAQTLTEWIQALPESTRHADSWLTYWLGTAAIPTRQAEARTQLESALKQFEDAQNLRGQVLSVCGIMEAHYLENVAFGRIGEWAKLLDRLVTGNSFDQDESVALRVLTNFMTAANFVDLSHPATPARAQRLMGLLGGDMDPGLQVVAGHTVLRYIVWSGTMEDLPGLVRRIEPILDHPGVRSLDRFLWLVRLVHCYLFMGNFDDATRCELMAEQALQAIPYHPTAATLPTFQLSHALVRGNRAQAMGALAETRRRARMQYPLERGVVSLCEHYLAAFDGDWKRALEHVQVVVGCFHLAGALPPESEFRVALVHCLWQCGLDHEAQVAWTETRTMIEDSYLQHFTAALEVVAAHAALMRGDHAGCDAHLRRALPRLRAPSWFTLRVLPPLLSRMLGRAVTAGIHVELAKEKIREFGLRPVPGDAASWPFPVRMEALGPFRLTLTPEPPKARAAQRKVRELLCMIVALGGRDVHAVTIMDALWPDTEGDAARRNLDVYLTRLRKFLGHPNAVVVRDARVQLDPDLCWVDLWEFQRLYDLRPWSGGEGACVRAVRAALSLYRGHLLADMDQEPWLVNSRQLWRKRWIALVDAGVEQVKAQGNPRLALDWLRQACEVDSSIPRWQVELERLRSETA